MYLGVGRKTAWAIASRSSEMLDIAGRGMWEWMVDWGSNGSRK